MNTLAAFVTALYRSIEENCINGILWSCIYHYLPSFTLSPIQRHHRMPKKERWFHITDQSSVSYSYSTCLLGLLLYIIYFYNVQWINRIAKLPQPVIPSTVADRLWAYREQRPCGINGPWLAQTRYWIQVDTGQIIYMRFQDTSKLTLTGIHVLQTIYALSSCHPVQQKLLALVCIILCMALPLKVRCVMISGVYPFHFQFIFCMNAIKSIYHIHLISDKTYHYKFSSGWCDRQMPYRRFFLLLHSFYCLTAYSDSWYLFIDAALVNIK